MADPTLAYGILASIILVIICAIFYLKSAYEKGEKLEEEPTPVAARPRGGRAAAQRTARERLRARLAERDGEPNAEEEPVVPPAAAEEDDEEEMEEDEPGIIAPKGKIGKKKAAKLQMKAEKRAMREQELKEREEQRKRDEERREEEKKREQEEAEEEARREEEERKLLEEKEKKEQEEYEKMKTMFVVEDSGYDLSTDENAQKDLLKEFVQYIKTEKIVVLDELAARFRLKTPAVIARITDMLEEGTLSGVMDDRGKFIYISMAELEGIAKFIRQRGRVTLPELVEESGTLVSLAT